MKRFFKGLFLFLCVYCFVSGIVFNIGTIYKKAIEIKESYEYQGVEWATGTIRFEKYLRGQVTHLILEQDDSKHDVYCIRPITNKDTGKLVCENRDFELDILFSYKMVKR